MLQLAKAKKIMTLSIPGKPWFMAVSAAALITGFLLISSSVTTGYNRSLLCSFTFKQSSSPLSTQMATTILHYATNPTTPQQSKREIKISLDVLIRRRPCNFLVFGLGHDSLMWASFNPSGYTLFLEEDPKWFEAVMKSQHRHSATYFPLNARVVKYRNHLSQADALLKSYRSEPYCLPEKAYVRGNRRCKLALGDMPREVYEREWDLIMIDAPKGFYPEAPGRMAAIWTAAVMARGRKGDGMTDVFLHDVNRRVEMAFALEFLCKKYRVGGVDRLWHFRIPAIGGNSTGNGDSFC